MTSLLSLKLLLLYSCSYSYSYSYSYFYSSYSYSYSYSYSSAAIRRDEVSTNILPSPSFFSHHQKNLLQPWRIQSVAQ